MKRWCLPLLAACCCAALQAATPWRLATAVLPPSIGPDLPQQGYYAVLLRRVLAELGAEPQFVFVPPHRAFQMAVDGSVEGALPFKRTAEREALFWFSEPFFHVRLRLLLRAQDDWEPSKPSDLEGHRGCSLQAAQASAALQREIDNGTVRLERVPTLEACYRMLRMGRVQYVIAGQNMAVAQLGPQPAGSLALRISPWVVGTEPVHLILPRKRADSIARLKAFDAAVRKLRASGELQALELQHVPRAPGATQP
ncbi:MAG: substrate-binding periplasmic protein [Burkholderiales bacterium]